MKIDDVGELYGRLSGRLEQIVRLDVRAQDVHIQPTGRLALLNPHPT